jgi:hypothetical protein
MRKPWLVTVVQVLIVGLLFSVLRGGLSFFVTDRSVLDRMETSVPGVLLRGGVVVAALAWLFFQIRARKRPAWPASLALLVAVVAVSASTMHSRMLYRVLLDGADAYEPVPGLAYPYGSRLQVETAAYLNVAMHVAIGAFVVAFAASRRVRDYLGWDGSGGSTDTNDAIAE